MNAKVKCGCTESKPFALVSNLAAGARIDVYQGRQMLVVPVVMLRQTVANEAFIHADELVPQSWNGVPVVVHHPVDKDGKPITANSPAVREKAEVGLIFNAQMDGDKLKAEAWIDLARLSALNLTQLRAELESGKPMDVSTGYFRVDVNQTGEYNGKPYSVMHQDIKPDHLALLPGAQGACSWADGCGIRVNEDKGGGMNTNVEKFIAAMAAFFSGKQNEGDTVSTKKTYIDILVNRKVATEAERTSLETLSEVVLKNMSEAADKAATAPVADPAAVAAAAAKATADAAAAATAAAASAAAGTAAAVTTLSAADQEALKIVREQASAIKAGVVAKIVANSDMKKEALDVMDITTLNTIASGLRVLDTPNYGGRAQPQLVVQSDSNKAEIEAMTPQTTASIIALIAKTKAGAQ